jgi:hypothetical protein
MAALSGGWAIFLVFLVVFTIGVIIALYTRRGSGMDHHPYRHVHGGAPGASIESDDYGGSDRTLAAEEKAAREWRRQERPPLAPPEDRARDRESEQRPEPGKKPSVPPPL